MPKATYHLDTIGRNAYIEFAGYAKKVPAKVDTGADSSAVWASAIHVDEAHKLHFVLFDKGSPYYTGEVIVTDDYSVLRVRSSSGHVQIRYRVPMSVGIAGRRIKVSFTLANRSKNKFPALIGRRTLAGKFVVDVSEAEHKEPTVRKLTRALNDELSKSPYDFHKKYHRNGDKNDKVET